MRRLVPIALLLALGALAAGGALRAHERITTSVTWDREISAIVRARCVTCHRDGGQAPMSLATYAEARPWARAIRHEVMTRRMPIWHAARGYGDFANDPSLSPFEIALIAAWVDGGAPRSFVPRGSSPPRLPGPPETPLTPEPSSEPARSIAMEFTIPCGESQAPAGRLLGLRPVLREHTGIQVTASMGDGRQETLGWFRDFNPKFAPTYWLRTPLALTPGTRISASPVPASPQRTATSILAEPCRLVLTLGVY